MSYKLSKTGYSCPSDIGLKNTWNTEIECEQKRFYGDCFHCWQNALYEYKKEIIKSQSRLEENNDIMER